MLEQQFLFDFVISFQLNVFSNILIWPAENLTWDCQTKQISMKAEKFSKCWLFSKQYSRWTLLTRRLTNFYLKQANGFWPEITRPLSENTNLEKNPEKSFRFGRNWFWDHQRKSFFLIVPINSKDMKFWEISSKSLLAKTRAKLNLNATS